MVTVQLLAYQGSDSQPVIEDQLLPLEPSRPYPQPNSQSAEEGEDPPTDYNSVSIWEHIYSR